MVYLFGAGLPRLSWKKRPVVVVVVVAVAVAVVVVVVAPHHNRFTDLFPGTPG